MALAQQTNYSIAKHQEFQFSSPTKYSLNQQKQLGAYNNVESRGDGQTETLRHDGYHEADDSELDGSLPLHRLIGDNVGHHDVDTAQTNLYSQQTGSKYNIGYT